MLAKSKIISILLIIIFCVSAITCGIVFGIVKSKSQTTATTEGATLTSNLFNTNGTINANAAKALLEAVGYYDYSATFIPYTAHNITGRTSNNSGNSIIFKMGYANGTSGTDLVWQATYLYNNYLTIWLDKKYTTSNWNSSSVTVSYDSYANSTIQAYLDDTLYGTITQSSSTLKSIFATPRQAGYQTIKSGTTNDTSYKYSSNHTSTFDNMAEGAADSYLWLPSFYEVYNTSTSSTYTNSTTTYTGQWGLNSTDRAFDSSTSYIGSSTSASSCWLRSGYSSGNSTVFLVYSSGKSSYGDVYGINGVRPAAHLSLTSIASFFSKTVTFNSNGGSSCASIKVDAGSPYVTLPTPTKTGYTFAGWYKSSDLSGNAVSTSDIVTTDHTLYAKWTAYTYYIEYNGNNATSGNMSVSTHTYDIAKALTTNTYTRTGYSFLGWSTSSTATTATYTNGQSVTNLTSTNGGLIVLYAVWQVNPYTITIQASSGGSITNTGGTFTYGDNVSSGAMPEVGKVFLYWVRASDNAQILENPLNQSVTKNEIYTAVFGASVEGVAVASTVGGIAYVIADYYDNLSDNDTITFVTKQVLQGYTFSHWEDMDGNNLGSAMSIKLTKAQVMDNIITAVYVQISNANVNEDVSN